MPGAIRLCGEAALRVGAGLVSVATHGDNTLAVSSGRPELMVHRVDADTEDDTKALLAWASVGKK
jgi:NAD(P)H-hydrate repair Nnr-like enzyme with NAD(P)H-hydrate dehydratase domain